MKKYVTLAKDYTSLITELTAYVSKVGRDRDTWFWEGKNVMSASEWAEHCAKMPSLTTTFADLGSTVYGFGHRFIFQDEQTDPNIFAKSILTIPLTTDPYTVTIYQPHEGIGATDNWLHPISQCDEIETFSMSEPILINRDITYTVEPSVPNKLVPFLAIMLSDTDSLFVD